MSVHVIQRGLNRMAIFTQAEDYQCFLSLTKVVMADSNIDIHGFVLMTTHTHLIVTPHAPRSLPSAMKRIGGRYARYFNRRYGRSGSLWNGRYRGFLIEDERRWFTCLRYIEQNPVRAGMVKQPADYHWSSYRANAENETIDWLVEHPLYHGLGRSTDVRRMAYRAICAHPLDDVELILQRQPPPP